jgi:hypothetical protein
MVDMVEGARLFLYTLIIIFFLPLAACIPERDTEPTLATPETAGAPATPELIGKPVSKATPSENESAYPESTAVLWADGFLWTANESGLLTRWEVETQTYRQFRLPDESIIRALASDGTAIYAGTDRGGVWHLTSEDPPTQIKAEESGWISALALDNNQKLWYAHVGHFDQEDARYQVGRGLGWLEPGRHPNGSISQGSGPSLADGESLTDISTLAFDDKRSILWIGTRFGGLLGYDAGQDTWQRYDNFTSGLESNTIHDIEVAPDGALWLATASGVSTYRDGKWETHGLTHDGPAGETLSLAIAGEGKVWIAGESFIAQLGPGETWHVYRTADNPLLEERVRFVVLDDDDHPWFIGRRGKIHFDGDGWIAYDADVRRFAAFTPTTAPTKIIPPPRDFPDPIQEYDNWVQTWPRPEADNGRGIHFLQSHQFDAIEAQHQANRMKRLGMRWTLVHYAGHEQLMRIAPVFQEAGITVIWRPFIRPYETYPTWAEDVQFLRSRGLAPYMQLYNEPSLEQEWGDRRAVDQEMYLQNVLSAARQVYDAGGYVGLQFVSPDWLRLALRSMREGEMRDVFDRLFFVPHLYGLNHPPEYDEDINSVLGFQEFALIFEEEIGFVPVMICGEGGWRLGEAQDDRYPAVSEQLHRDHHLAVFNWFRTGQLSDGQPLPDYFFAFCPWLISDPHDPAAWFDSDSGDRTLTIQAVEAMPSFERQFSWDK